MKKIAILVADGFEDVELIATLDHWKREGLNFELFSIENKKVSKGSFFAKIDTKIYKFKELVSCDALFIPGGKAKATFEKFSDTEKIIKDFNKNNKPLFSICAAPHLFYKAGVLKDKNFTCWPGLNLKESKGTRVEKANNIITARDYLTTLEFAETVSQYLKKLGW